MHPAMAIRTQANYIAATVFAAVLAGDYAMHVEYCPFWVLADPTHASGILKRLFVDGIVSLCHA